MTTENKLMNVTTEDVRKLRHMLGATDQYKRRDYGFRNYYATSGGAAMEAMDRLVVAGLATKGESSPSMTYYHATVKGCELIEANFVHEREIGRAA